jgi:hypothetical protein
LQKDSSVLQGPAKKKQPLNAPVVYEANDSIVFTQGGYAHLYGKGKVNYEKIELGAQVISMNMDSSTVYAHGVADTLGNMQGTPVFKDGETPYETKTIRYNFKSKKGLISNIVTQQGEGYVVGNNAKKGADDELFMVGGKYTTAITTIILTFSCSDSCQSKTEKECGNWSAYMVVEDVPLPMRYLSSSSRFLVVILGLYKGDLMETQAVLWSGRWGYYFDQ